MKTAFALLFHAGLLAQPLALHAGESMPTALEDLPECLKVWPKSREEGNTVPSECLLKVFKPLLQAELPFDARRVEQALGKDEFIGGSRLCGVRGVYVADHWALNAMHVIESTYPPLTRESFSSFQYAANVESPLSIICYGSTLFVGGHPLASISGSMGLGRFVDDVPLAEVFDIALIERPRTPQAAREGSLKAGEAPRIGDTVYQVGYPSIHSLCTPEPSVATESEPCPTLLRQLQGPLVSKGVVIQKEGLGIVSSNAAYHGNSGGPLLNEKGEILGVASTLIYHMKNPGVDGVEPWHVVNVGFNARMKSLMDALPRETSFVDQQ